MMPRLGRCSWVHLFLSSHPPKHLGQMVCVTIVGLLIVDMFSSGEGFWSLVSLSSTLYIKSLSLPSY